LNCWTCVHPSRGNTSRSSAPDPVGVCSSCSCLACSGHSGIPGYGSLICVYCGSVNNLHLKTYPVGGQGGSGGQGSGGPGGPGSGGQASGGQGSQQDVGQAGHSAKGVALFQTLEQALHELPELYSRGVDYALPSDMEPQRLIEDANLVWPELYGTTLSLEGLDIDLVRAAVGMVLWAAGVPVGDTVSPREVNDPWLVRVPLLRAALSARVPA
jgi:hypothetical protein